MEKIKKWRRFALALFSLLFVGILSFALVQIIPASAEEELVLPDNTAEYEIINDTSEQTAKNSSLWTYNRAKNEWTSSKTKSSTPNPVDITKANKLTLKVTAAGDIALKWKVSQYYSCAVAVKHYTNVGEEGIESLTPTYALNKGYGHDPGSSSYNFRIVFNEDDYDGEITTDDRNYKDLTVSDCAVNDVITIEFLTSSGYSSANMTVQGLKVPKTQFTITAKIAEGQQQYGTFHSEKSEETLTENSLTVSRGYDESVIFTAVPNDENVYAYWTDAENNKLTVNGELKLTGIAEKDNNTTYIAHFVTKDEMKPVSETEGDWQVDENGKATLKLDGEPDGLDKNLLFGFVIPEGGAFLEIDYTYYTAKDLNSTNLYIEEVEQRGNTAQPMLGYDSSYHPVFFMVRTNNDGNGNRPTAKYLQWVGVSGYFAARLRIVKGSYGYTYTEGDEFSINSIKVIKEPTEYQDLTFDFDSDLTQMTMKWYKGDRNSYEETPITAKEPVKVPVGLTNIMFSATQKGDTKASKYDNTKTVKYYTNVFSGAGEGFTKTTMIRDTPHTETWEDVSRNLGTSKYCYITIFNGSTITFSNGMTSTPVSGGGSHLPFTFKEAEIKVGYAEEVPISLTATAMTDGDSTDEEVEDGGFIGLPFGHSNSITLTIRKFENVTLDDLSICVDREEKKNEATEFPEAIVFPLQISGTQNIEISYLKADDNENLYSKLKLKFSVGETVEGTIDGLIDHTPKETAGSVEITNDVQNAWTFDPVLSSDENYAFSSIMDMEKDRDYYYGRRAVSSLTFTMTGAVSGGLSFEFRSEGYFQEGGLFTKALRVGQLWYRNSTPFTQEDNSTVGVQHSDKSTWTETLDDATCLSRPVASKDGGMEFASNAVALEDGWYQVSIPIQENTPLYLGFLVCGYDSGKQGNPEPSRCRASIRNVRLATGNKTATLKIGEDANEGSSATATVSGTQHTATEKGQPITVTAGSLVKLSATVAPADTFYGWSVNEQLVSTETEANVFVNDDSTIVAWIAPKDCYVVRADGTFYKTVEEAGDGASKGQTIYLLNEKATVNRSFTIKEGVTLLLPYDKTNKLTALGAAGTTAENKIAWLGTTYKTPYRSLTVKDGVTITVEGTLAVGGVVGYPGSTDYMGCTSGHYSELILETGSKIQVEKGGVMDVYGRVWGGEGATGTNMGTIDVAEGGKLYEPFLILDYAGGSNAAGMFLADNPTTPFKRYAMINVEVPMTINYGGALVGHASLYALSQYFSLDQTFIGDDSVLEKEGGIETFVMLTKGSKVTITYDSQKQVGSPAVSDCTEGIGLIKMVFEGGATFSYMLFSAMGFSVPTNSVYFSIPYNYEVEMNDFAAPQGDVHAQYETKTDFMIMPGAKVTVGEGATLTLNANAWVYDGLVQGNLPSTSKAAYPTAERLTNGGYSASGNFIVNGTLKIGIKTTVEKFTLDLNGGSSEPFVPKQISATFLGIIQTSGTTGKIEIPKDTVLRGTIFNGVAGSAYYFAYTATARLYDAAHDVLTPLVPEGETKLSKAQTYTATGGTAFKLDTLKYTKTDGGEENQTLTLNSGMVGSWMVDHEVHTFDWSQLTEEEKTLLDGQKYKDVQHQCTALGCEDKEHKLLLSADAVTLTDFYKGSAFTNEDLVKLFYKYYFESETVPGDLADCEFSATVSSNHDAIQGANTYKDITVTLTNGFFGDVKNTFTTFTFTIEKFNVADLDQAAIKNDLSGLVYNGTAQTPELTLRAEGLTGSVDHEAFEWSNNTNAGENTASVTIKGSGQNFEGTLTVNFSIAKATLRVEVVDKEKTYDGTAWGNVENAKQTTDFTIADGQIYNSDDLGLKLTVREPSADVGDYTVTGAASNANYTVTVTEGTYKITRAELTLTVTAGQKHTYGQSPDALTFAIEGFKGSDTEDALKALFELSSEGHDQWAEYQEGGYDITVSLKNGGAVNNDYEAVDGALKNYKVKLVSAKYTVEKKDIGEATFTVTEAYTYDKTEKKPTMSEIEVTLEGYADEHKVTFTVEGYSDNTDAGTAHLTVNATGNFTGTKAVDFTIGKATVDSITVNGEYAYTGAVQSDAVKSKIVVKSGALTLDTGDYTVTFDRNGEKDVKDAGTYTVTVELTKACKNYQLDETKTATFKVEKAEITIKADDQTTPQGEQILSGAALTWQVTVGQFFGSDKEEIAPHISVTTAANSEEVNNDGFDIKIGWSDDGYDCTNYTVTFENGKYYIIDAIFKGVKVTGQGTMPYDGNVHKLEVSINNESLNDKTTVTFTKDGESFEGATKAGTYVIHVNIKATGYQTEYNSDFTIIIEKLKITVEFDAQSSTYGETPKSGEALTYQFGGEDTIVSGEEDTVKAAIAAANPHTTATNTSGVDGSYTITTDKTPELDNYTITVKDGVYTITARAVDVTVNKQTVTYNQKPQSASSDTANWSVTNLAGGDEATVLNVELTAEGTNAGSYDITATWSNNNYAVTFKGADGLTVEQGNKVKNAFVIEAAELTDATVTGSYTYNGQTQTPTFNVKAGELTVAGSDFELEFAADADRVSAGTVQVTVKAKGSNYKGSLEKSFTIAAKEIKVTLNAQTADYSGEVPTPDNKAYTVNDGDLCSQNGVKDDLGVVITLVKGDKNVGSYGLDATASNENYEVDFDKTAQFSVTKKQITVKADDLKSFYGDDLKELTYTAKGLVEGEDAKTVLSITLEPERTIKEVGTYTIRGTGSAENYAFDKVEEGTYTVEKREVTVTIKDQSSLYDGTEPEVVQGQGDGWTVPDGSIIAGDNLFIVLKKAEGANAAEYAISGTFRNDNYNVTFKGTRGDAGKFTIRARQLTVEIHDQSETYDHEKAQKQYGKEYKFDGSAWSIVLSSGDGLADGETREMLGISLQVAGTLSNAGKYAIAGECGNTNYAVTFTGNYDEDGEYKGTAGLYTIEKLDVSEEAAFMLSVKDGSDIKTEEGGAVVRVKFAGKAIELVCETTLLMGEDSVELATKLSRESIGAEEGIGSYEITVTIDDVNYCGQAVITVIVTDANGYTQRLKDVLAQLGELTAELDKEHLKAEDYTVLLEVVKALGSLDEEEQKVGAEELAKYEEYVTAWEELADIDEVIETAKTVANAPIAALFEAAATLTALAGLAYIAFKGGML